MIFAAQQRRVDGLFRNDVIKPIDLDAEVAEIGEGSSVLELVPSDSQLHPRKGNQRKP